MKKLIWILPILLLACAGEKPTELEQSEPIDGIVAWWNPMTMTYTWTCPDTEVYVGLHNVEIVAGDTVYSPMTGRAWYVKWVKWL